jgi:hypothetical protein
MWRMRGYAALWDSGDVWGFGDAILEMWSEVN